ncbi:hypothetical protein [Duganella sp.]|uniref:hypothetical protein n=1 Tax=Duganella sp. TaxID=1904440 RepID=UPI0031D885DC
MTVRLLADYDRYPANAIVTLDAGTETGLINAKRALADLTGGVALLPESTPAETIYEAKTVAVGRTRTFTLNEGQVLILNGSAGALGSASQLNPVAGGSALASWAVSQGIVGPIGPYVGTQKVAVSCTSGSITVTPQDASASNAILQGNPAGVPFRLKLPDGRAIAQRRVGRRGTVVLDGSNPANWAFIFGTDGSSSLSSDAVNKQYSASGLSVNPGGIATQGVKRTLASTFAISAGTVIRVNLYIPPAGYSASQTFTIKFSSDANATKSLQYIFSNAHIQPGWNALTVIAGEDGTYEPQAGAAWTAAGGQAWGDNFNYFHIFGGANVANQPWVLDSVTIGAADVPRFVYTTDGTDPSILAKIAPAMAAYGFVGTAMIDGDAATVNSFAATAKLLMSRYGWELGVQGITHTSYNTNGRDIGADWDTCVANFLAAGLPAPRTFAYPQNAASVANDAILAARGCVWRRASGLDITHNSPGFLPGMIDTMVRQGCNAHSGQNYNTGTVYQQIKNRIAHHGKVAGIMSSFAHNESMLSTDWALGGDLSQFYMMLEQWAQIGAESLLASQVGAVAKQAVFY